MRGAFLEIGGGSWSRFLGRIFIGSMSSPFYQYVNGYCHGLILRTMTGVMHLSNVNMINTELHTYVVINLSYGN